VSQALYRKYRSRSFDEIVGQSGVITALQNALKNNAVSHAYLFTGPRGVGKTSIARIFAYAINNVPYDSDDLPVDIIEIDAASNRGIDEVRDLRDKVRIAPVVGPHKIYIIDEVHMLTSHAFNALLKTLEEPPAHVVFILATTESHKLPETITSRTQRYNFTLATTSEIVEHLADICKKEQIEADKDALIIIAKHSGGSLRDALSLLDHARHLGKKITAAEVRSNIGLPDDEIIERILQAVASNDASTVLHLLHSTEASTLSSISLARALVDGVTRSLQDGTSVLSLPTATTLLQSLVEVEGSTQQDIKLQIALLSAITPNKSLPHVAVPTPTIVKTPEKIKVTPQPKATVEKEVAIEKHTLETTLSKIEQDTAVTTTSELTHESWNKVLEDIRATHNTLYSVLRMAQVNLEEVAHNKLTLNFTFPFHQKRINEMKNKDIISNKLSSMGYGNFEINCGIIEKNDAITQKPIAPAPTTIEDKDPVLHQIRGVFGGAEVLE
jgi:DNA polymerase-3 subunit gamma/tau